VSLRNSLGWSWDQSHTPNKRLRINNKVVEGSHPT
jgi:hypothetical protein